MYRSILVPLDGSSFSEQALPVACDLARRSGAMLHLVHVHVRYDPTPISIEGLPVIDAAMHSLGKQYEHAYLEQIRNRLMVEGDLTITSTVLDAMEADGNDHTSASMIATCAASTNADLIVMTTHGRSGLEQVLIGSVANQVVRTSAVPVLLTHPDAEAQLISVAPVFRRILIPLDGSALAEQVVEPIYMLGDLTQAEYTLLHIVETHSPGPWELPLFLQESHTERIRALQVKAKAYLEQVAGRLRTTGLSVETYVRVADHAATAILDAAHDDRSDLIAIATHGRSGFPGLLLGSLAANMVRDTRIPMFVYHPQPAATQVRSAIRHAEAV